MSKEEFDSKKFEKELRVLFARTIETATIDGSKLSIEKLMDIFSTTFGTLEAILTSAGLAIEAPNFDSYISSAVLRLALNVNKSIAETKEEKFEDPLFIYQRLTAVFEMLLEKTPLRGSDLININLAMLENALKTVLEESDKKGKSTEARRTILTTLSKFTDDFSKDSFDMIYTMKK